MLNNILLESASRTFQVMRTLSVNNIPVNQFKSGKDGNPVIVCTIDPRRGLNVSQDAEERDGYLSIVFLGVIVIWKKD